MLEPLISRPHRRGPGWACGLAVLGEPVCYAVGETEQEAGDRAVKLALLLRRLYFF